MRRYRWHGASGRGLWSLLWLVVLLIGFPVGLVRYVGWPLPQRWPTGDDWQRWAQQPLSQPGLVDTVAVIGWLLWALLVYAVAVEAPARSGRAVSHLGWPRLLEAPTASRVLAPTVFGTPAPTIPRPDGNVGQTAAPASPTLEVALPRSDAVDDRATGEGVPAGAPAEPSPRCIVELPDGGWVTGETAAAISSAVALGWLQRRRRYLPRPPTGSARGDADLVPPPDTVAAVQDGLHRRHPDGADELGAAETAEPDQGAATAVTIGEDGDGPVRPDDLPAGGVGLSGPGAAAAARGLLVAVLLSDRHRDHPARLVTTAADLQLLLGPGAADRHRDTPGLTVTDGLDAAVAHLEQATRERHGARFTRAAQDGAGVPRRAGPPAQFGPLVLVTTGPADPATARRLAILLTYAAPLRVSGVLIGDWLRGAGWHVEPDGAVHPAGTPSTEGLRLSVLTSSATTDLLGLLHEAHPPRAHPAPVPKPRLPADDDGGDHGVPVAGSGPPPAQPRLRLRVLGAPSIHDTGATGTALRLRRTAALQILVFLAVHRDGATPAQLAAALRPGLLPHVAVNRLHTPISSLRTALKGAAGAHVLVRDGARYRLDDRYLDVDLWRLLTAVDDAATAPDPADRERALQAVVDTYSGDLAADRHWPWLAVPREAVRRHALDAYAVLAAAQPDPHAALALLQNALRVDACNEELHRRAMRAYAAIGDSPAARRLLTTFTRRLADLGLTAGDAAR